MYKIGQYNTLKIVKDLDFGVYLDGGEETEILLPARYVPHDVKVGDEVEVFIYRDNEQRLIATTDKPNATVGEFAFMEVKQVNDQGAFLDWGLMKDLLVPYREQKMPMKEGKWYLVYVRVDEDTDRIMASARVEKYLDNVPPTYQRGEEVNLLIADETDLGYRVIINNLHTGLVYHNEVFEHIERGTKVKGYIEMIREDGKIDVSLTPLGYRKIDSITGVILQALNSKDGFLPVHDKSDPEEIYALFRCSKKAFKQAIGALYRKEQILISDDGIRLTDAGRQAFADQTERNKQRLSDNQEKKAVPVERTPRPATDEDKREPQRSDDRRPRRDRYSSENRGNRNGNGNERNDRRGPAKPFSLDDLRPIK